MVCYFKNNNVCKQVHLSKPDIYITWTAECLLLTAVWYTKMYKIDHKKISEKKPLEIFL